LFCFNEDSIGDSVPIVKGFVGFGGGRVVPWGMGVARRITLVGLVKLKKGLESQTPRPVTGNLEVEPMDSKIFSGAVPHGFQNLFFFF
jgi:hypothetical protein